MSDDHARDRAWVEAMRCSPHYIPMVMATLPDHRPLAELAVQAQPNSADAWFWFAEVQSQKDPQTAIELYRRGLALRPTDSWRWRLLGDLLVDQDPQAAIDAYLMSCLNGDSGYNGCLRAGLTAERLGDIQTAIRYYRLSRLPRIWQEAERLEQQLREQTPP
jgi:tetratricopeptide (TPR) repeat protein